MESDVSPSVEGTSLRRGRLYVQEVRLSQYVDLMAASVAIPTGRLQCGNRVQKKKKIIDGNRILGVERG